MNKKPFNFKSIVAVFFIILITVALVKAYVLRQIEETARQEINNTLLTVLNTSHESFLIWAEAQKDDLEAAAASDHLLQLTKELLKAPRSKPALLNNPLQSELRAHLRPEMERHNLLGFFIIAPDFTSLSSMHDANIGTTNLMGKQKGFLSRVFKGETLISYPMKSDVPLPDHHGKLQDNLPTMFVATPIVDERKNIIAVMTFRFDPTGQFTKMLQLARLGNTGETYAFDVAGRLISNSRFDKEIHQAGLIKESENPILNVQIRDPGINLLEGETINVPINELPLTLMASEAIRGNAGSNIDSYRDYRGVPVVGAWLWDKKYEIGLATEMDKGEAYANLDKIKNLVLISFIITFISFALFATYVIFLGKRSEKDQLKRIKSEERFRAIFNESPMGVAVIESLTGKIIDINPKFSEIVGRNRDELLTLDWMSITHPDDVQPDLDNVDRLNSGEIATFNMAKRYIRPDDSLVWISLTAHKMPTSKNDCPTHLCMVEDITERIEAEENMKVAQKQIIATQKLAGVGELAAGVSHEVLNPVNIISVHTQMLQRKTKDDSNIQNFCNKVKHEVDRIQKIMSSLLAFSRKGQVDLELGQMRNEIEKTISLVENEYKLDNIKIVRDWCDLLVDISYDPDKIRQVYLNLINNAKHAMPDGGTITVGCRGVKGAGKNFHQFTFSDTGTGMSEEVRLKVFEPFFTTKPEGEGSGMGLSVIHGIIEEHGGKIRVESEEGKGTTFCISLPVAN
jgi:PAS domain S-box-containing protein